MFQSTVAVLSEYIDLEPLLPSRGAVNVIRQFHCGKSNPSGLESKFYNTVRKLL